MSEKCKTCKKEADCGIWMAPQFRDEKVLLFCCEKCRQNYIKSKLNKIKSNYPKYYKKLIKQPQKKQGFYDFEVKGGEK